MGLAGARKMGGSATREPELIYVVWGAPAMITTPGGRQNPRPLPSRPNVSFRARYGSFGKAYLELSGDAARLVVFFSFQVCNQKKIVLVILLPARLPPLHNISLCLHQNTPRL